MNRLTLIIIVLTFIGVSVTALSGSGYPDVHVSNETNKCVKVINYNNEGYSCNNMPERYNHVWVK